MPAITAVTANTVESRRQREPQPGPAAELELELPEATLPALNPIAPPVAIRQPRNSAGLLDDALPASR